MAQIGPRNASDEKGFCVIDAQRRIVCANAALAALLDAESPSALIGCCFDIFTKHGDDRVLELARARDGPVAARLRPHNAKARQKNIPAFLGFHVFAPDANGHTRALLIVTRRAFGHEDAEPRSARLEMALDAGRLGAWSLDLRTGDAWRTDLHDEIFGYRPKALPRWSYEKFIEHVIEGDREAVRQTIANAIQDRSNWGFECRIDRADGVERWISARGGFERDVQGEMQAMFGVVQDITERKAFEARIEFFAYYDPLTELPNRRLLADRLNHAIHRAQRSEMWGALFFIDLDDFKTLNDTLGHAAGDAMLQEVARRLCGCLRAKDTVARFGGDEFVVVMEDTADSEHALIDAARQVANKILHTITEPYDFSVLQHRPTSCSIGAVTFSGESITPDVLLRHADLAMYRAKAAGGHVVQFYEPQMQVAIDARVALESEIRRGLKKDEFVLHYQPQIDLLDGTAKAEALLRWQHPQRGLLSPGEFIPAAEESGLIVPLGRAVLQAACHQLRRWHDDADLASLRVAVNISARQFHQPSFCDDVLTVLEATGVDGHRLVFELTESLLLDNLEDVIEKMARLKGHGVQFALDDFGTGYSSLYYLKRLPLDQLKIDRRFVGDVLFDGNDDAIVRTIIALAHCMGLAVVAEGVETEAVSDFLIAQDCHVQQGFLFSEALPVEAFEAFMRFRHREIRTLRAARAADATRH